MQWPVVSAHGGAVVSGVMGKPSASARAAWISRRRHRFVVYLLDNESVEGSEFDRRVQNGPITRDSLDVILETRISALEVPV